MDDIVHSIIMAFSVIVFVSALSIVMYMFSQATSASENILYYADETNYYDNIEIEEGQTNREVDIDTVILTLYRYQKENFCVKIYDAPTSGEGQGELLQIFDVNIEGEVRKAAATSISKATKKQRALKESYDTYNSFNPEENPMYLFGVPWLGSTEDIKTRIDYYINGKSGNINGIPVDYENNKFYKIREYNKTVSDENKVYFEEEFVRYTYTGDTFVTEQGDILVQGAQPKDKIVIIYTATKHI